MPMAATPELGIAHGGMWGRLRSACTGTSEELVKLMHEFIRARSLTQSSPPRRIGTAFLGIMSRDSGSYHYHLSTGAELQKPGATSRELHDLSCAFRIAISETQQG